MPGEAEIISVSPFFAPKGQWPWQKVPLKWRGLWDNTQNLTNAPKIASQSMVYRKVAGSLALHSFGAGFFCFLPGKFRAKLRGVLTSSQGSDTMILMPKIVVDTGEVYSAAEAADLIGIGYATIYRWIKSGKLIPIKLAGRTLIPKSEAERLQKERAPQTEGALSNKER